MAQLTKQALIVENNQSFPNNNTGAITPTILRNFNTDIIDSTVNQETYNTASAVVDGRLDSLENFTGSALISASAAGGTITFEKGDGSTFDIAVTASVSSVAWDNVTGKPSGLVSGSEQVVSILTSVNAYTASNDVKWNTIGSQSGSWGASTNITSLNAFTASQETKNSTLGGVTASLQQQLTNIGSQSGSWVNESETGSFLVTASFDNGTRNLTFTQGNTNQFSVNIPDVSGSTGNFATTGSNVFNGDQTITGSLSVSGSTTFIGQHIFSGSVLQSGSLTQNGTSELSGSVNITGSTTIKGTTRFENSSTTITGSLLITGSTTQIGNNLLNGTTTLSGSVFVSGNIEVTNGANLITHNVKAAGSNGLDILANNGATIATMGQGGGTQANFVGSLSSGQFSASVITGLGSPASFSSSVDSRLIAEEASSSLFATKFDTIGTQSGSWSGGGTDITALNAFTASQQALNATLATTGSNSFIGNQTILGNITASGNIGVQAASVSTNASYPVLFISGGGTISKDSVDTLLYNPSTNTLAVSASTGNSNVSPNAITFQSGSGAYGTYASTMSKNGFISSVEGSGYISIQGNPSKTGSPSLTTSTKPGVLAMSSSGQPYVAIELQPSGSGFSDGRVTFPRNVAMLQNLEITGSLTSSLQQGYVWVGDINGRTTTVPTSSFGGGGAAFPYSGTASISGSLQVTGSMSGLVNELVVTSNTASIDFTAGNFFSITLAGGATTRFEVANTKLGQTINIQINQPAGASTGSVAFSPTILFAGGNDYQATATGSAIDLLTLAAITGSTVLATSIKNFL